MRRSALLTAFITLCLALAGCGGSGPKPSSPLDAAVGYFSKDAPFVAAIETDPDNPQIKQLQSLAGPLPVGPLIGSRLQTLAGLRFVDWSRDIRPQLGAPLVIGLSRPAAGTTNIAAATVVAMQVKHPTRVKQLLLRQPTFRGQGKASGVRIYADQIDSRYAAVDGNVLVAATNRDFLEHALSIKRTDLRMRASDFTNDLRGLPASGLVRISADPRQLIGVDPRLRPALDVKWISALRRMGAVAKVAGDGVTLDFHAATDPGSIDNADLPLAPGKSVLPLIGKPGEVQAAIREPGRLARLAVSIWRAIAPAHAAQFRSLEPRGVDLETQLPRHLAQFGNVTFNPFTRAFAIRIVLHDAADVKAGLVKVAPALPDLAASLGITGLGIATPAPGESFFALAKPTGKTAVFGVVGNTIVASNDAARAAGLASEPSHIVPGARGGALVTMDARALVTRLLAQRLKGAAALFAPLATSALKDLTGTFTVDRSGLDGHFKLTVVR